MSAPTENHFTNQSLLSVMNYHMTNVKQNEADIQSI